MFKNVKVQMVAVLAIGGLIGYTIASRQSELLSKSVAADNGASALATAPHVAISTAPAKGSEHAAVCLTETKSKSELMAMANPEVAQASVKIAASGKKPNIIVIMGDDIGMWNIGAYHRGMMAGRTPHLDKMAKEGMLFTDYYAEASCTAGRANFITGELPIRTGMTTVGQAGAKIGIPAEACTIATALKPWVMPPASSAKTISAT